MFLFIFYITVKLIFIINITPVIKLFIINIILIIQYFYYIMSYFIICFIQM